MAQYDDDFEIRDDIELEIDNNSNYSEIVIRLSGDDMIHPEDMCAILETYCASVREMLNGQSAPDGATLH